MKERIDRLLEILNKYSTAEINKIYCNKEVELEIESFTKHPDVGWSESLKKKMIQAAKRKRISKGRIKYLEDQIKELSSYNSEKQMELATEDLALLIENLSKRGLSNSEVKLLHIEFSDFQHLAYVQAYGKYEKKWYENEIGGFESLFNSAKYWDELDSSKFNSIYELLEIVEIEDEEYPSIFIELRVLRVFEAIKRAMQKPIIKMKLSNCIPNADIEIGNHDAEFYIIRKREYAT